jgi:hypothetical protein
MFNRACTQDELMCTADRQQIGLRVVQEMANEPRDLLAIVDEGREVRRKFPFECGTIFDRRGCGRKYVVQDVVDRVPRDVSLSFMEGLGQLRSEFRRFCGMAGKSFGLVVQARVTNGGEKLLGLCQ